MPAAPIISFVFLYTGHVFLVPQDPFLNEWISGCGGAGEGSRIQPRSGRQGSFSVLYRSVFCRQKAKQHGTLPVRGEVYMSLSSRRWEGKEMPRLPSLQVGWGV